MQTELHILEWAIRASLLGCAPVGEDYWDQKMRINPISLHHRMIGEWPTLMLNINAECRHQQLWICVAVKPAVDGTGLVNRISRYSSDNGENWRKIELPCLLWERIERPVLPAQVKYLLLAS